MRFMDGSSDVCPSDLEAIREAARDAHWPTRQWWTAYGDRQLDRWIDLAVHDSPSLALAAARVRPAQAMDGVVEAAESPQETGRASGGARVCEYVELAVVAVSVKKNRNKQSRNT